MVGVDLLQGAVTRTELVGQDGLSGAGLERAVLADGRAVVVKRIIPRTDLTLSLTGGTVGREHLLRTCGALDRLPAGVGHAVLDSWVEDDTTVLVMRDLGDAVLTWDDRLPAGPTTWLLERLACLHRTFLRTPPPDLAPLDQVLDLFSPGRVGGLAAGGNQLMQQVVRGWELFGSTVPVDVAMPVFSLLDDVTPLATALAAGPVTWCHGDLATVNMAFERDVLVLIDWSMTTAAPGSLDIARFVAGCSSVVGLERDEMLACYARAAGPAYDERSMGLSLLAGLLWLGWNKALDAFEHSDPVVRRRERDDLGWWVSKARATLATGVLG